MGNIPLDELTEKAGGRFRLVCLVQKRMREIQKGLPPLVDVPPGTDPMEIVVREIMADKVKLLTGEAAEKARREMAMREAEAAEDEKIIPPPAGTSAPDAQASTSHETARRAL
ncbi:MAG: DNA-directed RNA polymerase subunit omega [Planctomycetota bacterium]|nr:DNA-directed RNA polymerase subunit omega [Planctomycetota bacterium]